MRKRKIKYFKAVSKSILAAQKAKKKKNCQKFLAFLNVYSGIYPSSFTNVFFEQRMSF